MAAERRPELTITMPPPMRQPLPSSDDAMQDVASGRGGSEGMAAPPPPPTSGGGTGEGAPDGAAAASSGQQETDVTMQDAGTMQPDAPAAVQDSAMQDVSATTTTAGGPPSSSDALAVADNPEASLGTPFNPRASEGGPEISADGTAPAARAATAAVGVAEPARRVLSVRVLFSSSSSSPFEAHATAANKEEGGGSAAVVAAAAAAAPTAALSFLRDYAVSEQGGGAPRRARALFPCVDAPGSFHTFELRFLVPPEERAVCCGR